ncbi:toxin glutamine deamidase domain-containing protein [Streptomyces sioyaensis]|uniref:WXG100-like domain-containing protein n=1 Tax=Streptomyces sioyaensis TaxID=67364 RepID=UPI003400E4CB
MGAADKAKEIVQDLTGMWWPEGDEDELREAARAWRTFADDVEDCTAACHKKAQDVIDNNKGKSIEAFGGFWRQYHGGGKGYLDDVATAARDMAKALDKYADQVAEAKKKIEHELEIAGAVLVAGTALALFTGGISEVAAAGATEAIVAAASTAGVAVSATVAEIAGTVLATAAIGGIEAITVDVVVAQGGRNLLGDQKGISLKEASVAGVSGLLLGGAFGGARSAATRIAEGPEINSVGNLRWGEGGGGTTLLGDKYKTPVTEDLHKLINPGGGTVNCRACTLAVDRTLEGAPASALPGIKRGALRSLEQNFPGKRFRPRSFSWIVRDLKNAGDGARAIVYGSDEDGGHVFNIINRDGDVIFLDGQNGHASHAYNWDSYQFMRTK